MKNSEFLTKAVRVKSSDENLHSKDRVAFKDGPNLIDVVFEFSEILHGNCAALQACIRADEYRDVPLILHSGLGCNGELVQEVKSIRDEVADDCYRLITLAHSLRIKARHLTELTGHRGARDWTESV